MGFELRKSQVIAKPIKVFNLFNSCKNCSLKINHWRLTQVVEGSGLENR